MQRFNFSIIEKKWQNIWEEKKLFKSEITDKKKILLSRNVSIPLR